MTPRILASIAWLCISLSLGTWWTIMGLRQAQDMAELEKKVSKSEEEVILHLNRKLRMIKYEGVSFLMLITLGGMTLIFMSFRDERKNQMIKDFFATVSHEMKTPLASLRLQAESLSELIRNKAHKRLLERLISDTQRLELQMEKAMYLASITRSESLYISKYSIKEILNSILIYYENVIFQGDANLLVQCDKKAMESILKNLLENAFHHGQASQVIVKTFQTEDKIVLEVSDNGKGFQGNKKKIGKLFFKHTTQSGSGIGLYLVQSLVRKMGGRVEFLFPNYGFTARFFLKKATESTGQQLSV